MAIDHNPFTQHVRRAIGTGDDFHDSEVGLAHRNHGMPLEMLAHDVTPTGMHYLLTHFDIPYCSDQGNWRLVVEGEISNRLDLDMADLKSRQRVSRPVTLECAGNGRALHDKRNRSMPWHYDAVGTSIWTGTPLLDVLNEAGISDQAVEIAFYGADRGFDNTCEHLFARSLSLEQVRETDVMLVYEMNGHELLPQHGYPLRLIVPGWYGMASVKWLNKIEVLDKPFDGFQQIQTYRYRDSYDEIGVPVTKIKVKSMMIPPGIPDWYSRVRMVDAGVVTIVGRAWSGSGTEIEQVEFSQDGLTWNLAEIEKAPSKYAWTKWTFEWNAAPGRHQLHCRATDANGDVQPATPPWDASGFGNNSTQKIDVIVRETQ